MFNSYVKSVCAMFKTFYMGYGNPTILNGIPNTMGILAYTGYMKP
jgi:hypothetical protein